MDSEEEFLSHLHIIDNLYCDVLLNGKRYVCRSKRTPIDTWKLSCTNAIDSFWERDLEYEDVKNHVMFMLFFHFDNCERNVLLGYQMDSAHTSRDSEVQWKHNRK